MSEPNLKMMVNWSAQQVVHTSEPVGSKAYQKLIQKGYVKVGTIKGTPETQIFWDVAYFNPTDKYLKVEP